uniref:Uncharacterized protein n=1 Tax=Anopheles atroparvus TaxID=41427 RepID=A0AAG5D7Y2_ANOAO
MNARHQRWMRQRTLPLFMVTALCIIGLEGTAVGSPGDGAGQTKDTPGPLLEVGHRNASSAGERQRRLIPYMQYYVTSTAAPAGTDSASDYQPSFNQVYNYRPINGPLRDPSDSRPSYYPQKQSKPQQPTYRPQEDSIAYEYQSPRPAVHYRKQHHYNTPAKLVPAAGYKTPVPVSISPFTYEYNHRHQQGPVKGDVPSSPAQHSATSYAVLSSASASDHGGGQPVELYERPKYAVIPREREPPYDPVPQRFAVLPAKVYGIEVHTKSQPHPEEDTSAPSGGKFYLPNVPSPELVPSRKPTLYQSVPVYKKNRINPFLPSNTIPGPFTPMTSSNSNTPGQSASSHGTNDPRGQREGPREEQEVVQVTYVKSPVTERPVVEYQSYDHGAPVQDSRGHGEGFPSPYVLVKTVPKYYYEKPRSPVSATPTPVPYQVYYKEKPNDGRKQHSNHS